MKELNLKKSDILIEMISHINPLKIFPYRILNMASCEDEYRPSEIREHNLQKIRDILMDMVEQYTRWNSEHGNLEEVHQARDELLQIVRLIKYLQDGHYLN